MIDSMHVLDVLRERGYVPQDDADAGKGWGELWFDHRFGAATVRAVLTPEDENEVYLFTGPMVCEWSVRFSGAPGAVFLATLDAAEHEAGIREGVRTS